MDDDREVEINSERLISLVKDRPVIYNTTLPANHCLMEKIWLDICKNLIPGWDDLNLFEKEVAGKKVKETWQHMRSCFLKEYYLLKGEARAVRHGTRTSYTARRDKYEYYDQLQFLLPTIKKNTSRRRIGAPVMTRNTSSPFILTGNSTILIPQTLGERSATGPAVRIQGIQLPSLHTAGINTELYRAVNPRSYRHVDEDKLFLLSLLPSLQRMTTGQKMNAKIKFLKAINDVEEEEIMQGTSLGVPFPAHDSDPPEALGNDASGPYYVAGAANKRIRVMPNLASSLRDTMIETANSQETNEVDSLQNRESRAESETEDSLDEIVAKDEFMEN